MVDFLWRLVPHWVDNYCQNRRPGDVFKRYKNLPHLLNLSWKFLFCIDSTLNICNHSLTLSRIWDLFPRAFILHKIVLIIKPRQYPSHNMQEATNGHFIFTQFITKTLLFKINIKFSVLVVIL